jgi:fused-like protein
VRSTATPDVVATVNKYAFMQQLGRGRFGVVWSAVHTETGKRVAVKRILMRDAAEREVVERELHRLTTLRVHRHVVRTREVLVAKDEVMIVMELCRGPLMQMARCRQPHYAEDHAVRFTRHIVSALHFLHTQRIVHREVKPENVLLTFSGSVRLCDFGLTSLVGEVDGENSGTRMFMAPELLTSRERQARPRSIAREDAAEDVFPADVR